MWKKILFSIIVALIIGLFLFLRTKRCKFLNAQTNQSFVGTIETKGQKVTVTIQDIGSVSGVFYHSFSNHFIGTMEDRGAAICVDHVTFAHFYAFGHLWEAKCNRISLPLVRTIHNFISFPNLDKNMHMLVNVAYAHLKHELKLSIGTNGTKEVFIKADSYPNYEGWLNGTTIHLRMPSFNKWEGAFLIVHEILHIMNVTHKTTGIMRQELDINDVEIDLLSLNQIKS